jgi:hypothetical protein
MCMHPWFFSIGRLHLGHGFELASILQVIKLTVSSGSQITTIQKAAIYTWRLSEMQRNSIHGGNSRIIKETKRT